MLKWQVKSVEIINEQSYLERTISNVVFSSVPMKVPDDNSRISACTVIHVWTSA